MDTFKNATEYISIVFGAYLTVLAVLRLLNLLQQSHYHFSGFIPILRYYYYRFGLFLIPFVIFIFLLGNWYVQIIYSLYGGALVWYYKKHKPIIELNVTPRIKRLLFTILIVTVSVGTLLHYFLPLPQLHSSLVIIYILLPLLIFLAAGINYPIEYSIAKYYQSMAKNKLKKYHTIVIGITGSYGKTSTKNILYSFLKEKEMVICTDKSYNTLNGIALNINQKLFPEHRYLIAEMGASRKGDIKKLNAFIKPQYGIVTAVGPQHLKTFKSMENIVTEKMRLIVSLPHTGIGIINNDDSAIAGCPVKTEARIVTFGIESPADYRATHIKTGIDGLYFTINYPGGAAEIKAGLLGYHNIYNILAGFALARELGVSVSEIVFQASRLEPVKNRLSVTEEGGLTILEDAFNSNYHGFINALAVLANGKELKILITPGIVETGQMEKQLNYALSEKISQVCDFVVLIKSKTGMIIKDGLDNNKFSNYILADNYKTAINYVKNNFSKATVLIENDIADIYKI
ncbi:MAG: UDP-N-acetylmuramoyl-tripeptide--D-alanyl-D-alanine ligase [Bacilli bacterium]|nr:UDP-N-acetylmuramoyl-tripeptide--D-alanyl-D-alanine ligase [Bacilli bacterium]MDD4076396.1 UDP-N-acetylmuramoyl-tripeptide--D-alanyl-D-alanine ligase [Bacilli bacterium]MDD4388106.1 UDP-N-acetylmuramoyl-tripeptide--D-alanyl-D-alanine ligase [Bacilli bacterium]